MYASTAPKPSILSTLITALIAGFMAVSLSIAYVAPASAEVEPGVGGGESGTSSECDSKAANCCNGVATAIDYGCKNSSDEIKGNPLFGLLLAVINFLAVGVGIAVVGGVVYGSVRYITANGNSSKTQEAVKIITNALLALVLFAFLYAIINFLVPGGVFN